MPIFFPSPSNVATLEEERDTVEKEVGEALDENFQALEEKKKNKDKRESMYCMYLFRQMTTKPLLIYVILNLLIAHSHGLYWLVLCCEYFTFG